MLTAELLREIARYEPETGEFFRRIDAPRGAFKVGDRMGRTHPEGYRLIKIRGRDFKAHRLAWLYVHGEWPIDEIDHINGQRGDNRIANLRDVPKATNQQNQKAQRNTATGILGVTRKGAGFQARLRFNNERHYVGYFKTLDEACAAYLALKQALQARQCNTL
jgi:hypothetical protein